MKSIKETIVYKNRIAVPSAVRKYFNINDGDPLMWCIDNNNLILCKTAHDEAIERSDVLYGLEKYGYELITPEHIFSLKDLNPEEIIVYVLVKFPEPRLIEGLPILILNNKINVERLYKLSTQYNLNNKVGYILDICIEIARKLRLKTDIKPIKRVRDKLYREKDTKQILLIDYKSDAYVAFAKEDLDPILRKWNIIARFTAESFITQYKKYSRK